MKEIPTTVEIANTDTSPPGTTGRKTNPGGRKTARLSLSRILLSLDSNASKQKSLQHILNALQIMYAREAVVAAIAPHNNVTQAPPDNNPETSQVNTMESVRSREVEEEEDESPADVVDIALGGGEAPACRAEVSSTSLSINTSPEEEDANSDFCPVFAAAGPSTSSKTQSLPRGSGRVSALVGAMIASSKEFVPPDKIEEEEAASGGWW